MSPYTAVSELAWRSRSERPIQTPSIKAAVRRQTKRRGAESVLASSCRCGFAGGRLEAWTLRHIQQQKLRTRLAAGESAS